MNCQIDLLPILVELGQLCPSLRRQLVVLAWRTNLRFLPFIVDKAFPAHLAEQRVERAFLGCKFRVAQTVENVRDIDLIRRHDPEYEELQESFANGAKLSVDPAHS